MQKTINENISMGNTIIQASNIEPKFKIDPIQFKECVFYEIWTIKNPQNTSYTLSAERCQTAFLSNKELIKYADPSFVMGNFTKDNQENILGIKAVKEELSKPSYVTDVKSYKFISDKYKILENGNYIYILQNFKAKSEILGEYTQNAHIIFDNKGNVIKIELNQNKEFGSYWLKLQFKFKVERKIICRKNTTFYFSFATFYFSADIIPETIGSIVYLSKHLEHLKKYVKAGFVLSCLGDDHAYSLIHTPKENTLSDKVALHTLKNKENFKAFSFLDRGSDERQYNAPLVNLGIVGVCRTRYGDYDGYHNSKDDLNFISEKGLMGGLSSIQEMILNLEINAVYENTIVCEPNLGKRGLYHTLSTANDIPLACNFLAYCDGENDIIDIANILNMQAYEFKELLEKIKFYGLVKWNIF